MKESKQLEFKSEITNTFLKTVSAFSNYYGGEIIFGIDDSGDVIGLRNPEKSCLDIENKINDSIKPQPVYELKINETDNTVSLKVEPGKNKPYMYKSKAYRRNDSATIEVDELELLRLILEGKNINYEELPAKNQSLTFNHLEKIAKKEIGIENLDNDVLKTLNLYTDVDGYKNAAELLADENSFPGIDIAKFGESISIIIKRVTIKNKSVLEELEKTVQIYRDFYQYEEIEGMNRKKIAKIPEEAFREAIANAITHRTWDVDSQIRVMMYDDRIEIISPGGLPSGLSTKEYIDGKVSILRNPILANVFYRLHIVEILGTGIIRIKEAYQTSNKKPIFEVFDNSIKVTLPVVSQGNLNEDEKTVYDTLSKITPKSISEITENVPFGKSKTSIILKVLTEKGYVNVIGRGRGTKYKI